MKKITTLLMMFVVAQNILAQIPAGKKVISALYVYSSKTGKSELILREHRHFEAPNWSRDGKFLLINSLGKLEKISPTGEKLGVLNTGTIQKANNDHGYSFDGKTLFISSGKPDVKGGSYVYKVSSEGGEPMLLTEKTPSYWHGVSPDGSRFVYCASRNDNFDIYAMDSNGGPEIRLTEAQGLDDGPEYSPDGKYIYMNSFRTGKMQIWRMAADGSNPEQMTFDDYSNWFAHISPNGKVATVISYVKEPSRQTSLWAPS